MTVTACPQLPTRFASHLGGKPVSGAGWGGGPGPSSKQPIVSEVQVALGVLSTKRMALSPAAPTQQQAQAQAEPAAACKPAEPPRDQAQMLQQKQLLITDLQDLTREFERFKQSASALDSAESKERMARVDFFLSYVARVVNDVQQADDAKLRELEMQIKQYLHPLKAKIMTQFQFQQQAPTQQPQPAPAPAPPLADLSSPAPTSAPTPTPTSVVSAGLLSVSAADVEAVPSQRQASASAVKLEESSASCELPVSSFWKDRHPSEASLSGATSTSEASDDVLDDLDFECFERALMDESADQSQAQQAQAQAQARPQTESEVQGQGQVVDAEAELELSQSQVDVELDVDVDVDVDVELSSPSSPLTLALSPSTSSSFMDMDMDEQDQDPEDDVTDTGSLTSSDESTDRQQQSIAMDVSLNLNANSIVASTSPSLMMPTPTPKGLKRTCDAISQDTFDEATAGQSDSVDESVGLVSKRLASSAAVGSSSTFSSFVRTTPRDVDYQCVVCSETYPSQCMLNPWWALEQHDCPKCHKRQIPRIDITLPANAMDYHPALLAEEGDDDSDDEGGSGGGGGLVMELEGLGVGVGGEGEAEDVYDEDECPLTHDQSSKLLVLLSHARTCPGHHRGAAQARVCASAKFLMLHVRDCDGKTLDGEPCGYTWCRPCKLLLGHLVRCTDNANCSICSPKDLSKSYEDLRAVSTMREQALQPPPMTPPSPSPSPTLCFHDHDHDHDELGMGMSMGMGHFGVDVDVDIDVDMDVKPCVDGLSCGLSENPSTFGLDGSFTQQPSF